MDSGSTRRQYLSAMGGTVTLGAVSWADRSPSLAACEDVERLEAKLASKRESLQEKQAALRSSKDHLSDLRTQILHLHAESYPDVYDEQMRQAGLELGKRMRESVVLQEFAYEHGGSTSTGWFVDEHHIVTNAHNVDNPARKKLAQTLDGDTFEFEILGYDDDLAPDVALLRTDYSGTPLPTGDSTALTGGEPLVIVGHPGGFGYWVVGMGPYEGRATNWKGVDKLNTGVPAISGSSGSPVATMDGDVVGMLYASSGVGGDTHPNGNPAPASDDVRYRLLAPEGTSELVPIEVALERTEAWR